MSDVLRPIDTGQGIMNGAAITHVTKTGRVQTYDPQVNHVPDSGVLHDRLTTRFDEHYGGGPS